MGKFLIGLLWLATATYAGYILTAKSFSFLNEPSLGLGERGFFESALPFNPAKLTDKLPQSSEDAKSWFDAQPAEVQRCLRTALGQKRIDEAFSGKEIQPSPGEVLAISKCLK